MRLVNRSLAIATSTVSIHAPGRGATHYLLPGFPGGFGFNSRTREGCDTLIKCSQYATPCFNSRTREGCDDAWCLWCYSCRWFQFTHPGGVRLVPDSDYSGVGMFQFTHPGGVRPSKLEYPSRVEPVSIHAPGRGATSGSILSADRVAVSIHAPGRGATEHGMHIDNLIRVSIHAPGRGATTTFKSLSSVPNSFQFTHPGGVRLPSSPDKNDQQQVSIHAPGRGATFSTCILGASFSSFNSRTREGCDSAQS